MDYNCLGWVEPLRKQRARFGSSNTSFSIPVIYGSPFRCGISVVVPQVTCYVRVNMVLWNMTNVLPILFPVSFCFFNIENR